MTRAFRVAIVSGGLDLLHLGNGQYRYLIDLITGLADLDSSLRYVVLGARPGPPPEVAGQFRHENWQYRQFTPATGRGAHYRDLLRITAVLWRIGADLCHSLHTLVPFPLTCPVVTTQYDLMYELFPEYEEAVRSRPYRIHRWAVKHIVRRVLCISAVTAADLNRLWSLPLNCIDVAPLGTAIPAAMAADLPPLLDRLETPLILSPYNLEPRKNLASLIIAFADLARSFPEVRLVLFGKAGVTPQREQLIREQISSHGMGDRVILTGFLEDAQLRALYRRATVFVFPSLYEGFGLPVLEAMACGACVVVRDASSMADVVGDAGVRLETSRPDLLAAGLTHLLNNPVERERLGKAARARAALFTVRRMAEDTLACYMRALGQKVLEQKAAESNGAPSGENG